MPLTNSGVYMSPSEIQAEIDWLPVHIKCAKLAKGKMDSDPTGGVTYQAGKREYEYHMRQAEVGQALLDEFGEMK